MPRVHVRRDARFMLTPFSPVGGPWWVRTRGPAGGLFHSAPGPRRRRKSRGSLVWAPSPSGGVPALAPYHPRRGSLSRPTSAARSTFSLDSEQGVVAREPKARGRGVSTERSEVAQRSVAPLGAPFRAFPCTPTLFRGASHPRRPSVTDHSQQDHAAHVARQRRRAGKSATIH